MERPPEGGLFHSRFQNEEAWMVAKDTQAAAGIPPAKGGYFPRTAMSESGNPTMTPSSARSGYVTKGTGSLANVIYIDSYAISVFLRQAQESP
jgi:hypothetical protein